MYVSVSAVAAEPDYDSREKQKKKKNALMHQRLVMNYCSLKSFSLSSNLETSVFVIHWQTGYEGRGQLTARPGRQDKRRGEEEMILVAQWSEQLRHRMGNGRRMSEVEVAVLPRAQIRKTPHLPHDYALAWELGTGTQTHTKRQQNNTQPRR